MRIVLVGNYPADQQQSMLRYARFLQRELSRAGHEVRLVSPPVIFRRLLPRRSRLGKWLGYVDRYLLFRLGFSRLIRNADVVHICDHSNAPYLGWIKGVPGVITCHDALAIRSALGNFPENPTRQSGKMLQGWIRRSLRHADHIIYVSNKTRCDFEDLLGIDAPSDVILNPLNWSYSAAAQYEIATLMRVFGIEQCGYILHVGGNDWYKNRLGVLQMFAELRRDERFRSLRLVMVGKPFTEEMRAWCRANYLQDVLEIVDIENDGLRVLYSGALALLFPSFEEGFGWPILEAQACGCPVITSHRPPMSEVAGNAAKLIDPRQIEAVCEAVAACLGNRAEMVAAGHRNLERFAVQDVIRRYEQAYQVAMGREAIPEAVLDPLT